MEPLQSERITIETPHGKSLGSAAASYVHLLTDDLPDPGLPRRTHATQRAEGRTPYRHQRNSLQCSGCSRTL